MKKYIMFLFIILLLLIIPLSFANDNSTYDDSYSSENDDGDITPNIIYFNSSAENDGNGSQSNPYKYFSNSKVSDNSILYFADGKYSLDQDLSFSNLTIIGNNPKKTIINGNDKVITSRDVLNISNLTLNYLSIKNSHDLVLDNIIFQKSDGVVGSYNNILGGAININGNGNTLIISSTFKNNNATYGGAIYASEDNNLTIINSIFQNNQAYKYGGAIAVENGVNLKITDSRFIDCYSISNAGGAIYSKESTLTVESSNFTSCNATFGGAICDLKSDTIIDSIIANSNEANYQGGAVYKMYGTIEVKSSSFSSNEASNGGAIYIDNSSSVSIDSSSFSSNVAASCGGAIYTILNLNESLTSINYKNNKAKTENNYYKGENYSLFIGNGNYIMIKGDFEFNGTLPSKYDLRDYGWVTPVKNQKSGGNCWAFTSNAALESCILKATNQAYDLSEENMKNVMAYYSDYGWKLATNKGGYDDMGVGYLVGWLGAFSEDFETFSDHTVLSPVLNSSIHVQNLIYLTRNNYTDNYGVKEAIFKYGAATTGIYYSGAYFKGNSYYYPGNTGPNHAVTIVGWDDNYSKYNFRTTAPGDGAWICKNSWGESWGDKGYFYVSYYDTKCVRVGPYDKSTYTFILNDSSHYDKNYQYDIIGITDYLITGKSTIWYENIFNATDNELLKAFSTYFNTTTNWTAQIYVNNDLKLVQSGITYNPGYYTFDLDKQIPLKKGDTFKIVIKISADKYASFPISEKVRSTRILYSKGVSFFSYDGKEWIDLYDYKADMSEYGHSYESQVACIKAFTSHGSLSTNTSITNSNQSIAINVPFNLTAVVKDQYGGIVNYGNVKFTIGSKTYNVPIVNNVATLTTKIDSKGIYNVKAQYLKNSYYSSSSDSKDINVSITAVNLTLSISDIYYGENLSIKNKLSSNGVLISDYITVKIKSKSYSLKSNTETTITDILNPGKYDAYAKYYNIGNASTTFNVNKIPISMSMNIKMIDVDAVLIKVKLSQPINASVNLKVNSKSYPLKTINGIANLTLNDLDYGNYSVNAKFSNAYYEDANASGKFSVNYVRTHLIADNVTLYYHDGTRFYVSLVDKNNNPLANENINFTINGRNTTKYTDKEGKCSIALQLNSGSYPINITYFGNGKYLPDNLTRNVLVKPTIISNDITKIFRNSTPFTATILDGKGNPVKNTEISMNINGVFYKRNTDSKGVVKLNLNLPQGNYLLTTNNPVTGENAVNNVTIIPSIVENNDLVMYYKNGSKYSVKLLGSTGSPLANTNVTFNINGVYYNRVTDSNGIARLSINLIPNEYTITAEYNGCRVSNTIVVLPTIESGDLSMKYKDGSKFKVKILNGIGKPYPSQKVIFNINGVFYNKITDENGIAALSINLLPGKYIITSSYNGLNAANTITISG